MENTHKEKLTAFYQREKRMPTYTEMMGLFGFKSKNAVARLVDKLLDAGLVAKDKLGRLIPTTSFNEVPMLGSVKAGFPSMAEMVDQDTISLDGFLIQKKDKTYILTVDGDSMIDAHIANGDLVIAERVDNYMPKDGEIVIAEVDGEYTMKYFKKEGSKVWLQPANKNFKNIYPENDLQIKAVVKGVIRKY
jgi:SOS regulatory protein LexA